jgi:hypothetical protein
MNLNNCFVEYISYLHLWSMDVKLHGAFHGRYLKYNHDPEHIYYVDGLKNIERYKP